MEDLITKVFAITSFTAACLTILAIIVAVIVILVNGLKKAKAPDSPGGTEITKEEAEELLLRLLPMAVKLLITLTKGEASKCVQDKELTKE